MNITASVNFQGEELKFDLSQPIDISIPVKPGANTVRAWYLDPVRMEPVMTEHFVGDVNRGGAVNFRDIYFNPHGHGTHTENVGHISKEPFVVSDALASSFFMAQVVTINPIKKDNDLVIDRASVEKVLQKGVHALIIRTVPNEENKRTRNYSNTNPPYLTIDAMKFIVETDIKHLLVDTPSVDKEQDDGELACHHIFWDYPDNPRVDKTITELIYVPDSVSDGIYLLDLQTAHFVNDATPSRPVLYGKLK